MSQLIDCLQLAANLFNQSTSGIIWNLFLALIPLALSLYLFRSEIKSSFLWWILLIVFIAFLPNAPYVLTDSIHIIELSQKSYPLWAIIFILIPQYALFIVAGFEAYVISLMRLETYLLGLVASQYLLLSKIIIHSLCVIGIYIGRFERFNSWDLVTKPVSVILTTIQDILDGGKLLSMAIALILIWLLTELTRWANLKISRAMKIDIL